VAALVEVGDRGGSDQPFLLSPITRRGPWNNCANLPAVVEATSQDTRIGLLRATADLSLSKDMLEPVIVKTRLGPKVLVSTYQYDSARCYEALPIRLVELGRDMHLRNHAGKSVRSMR
jgi:hypothetical protein